MGNYATHPSSALALRTPASWFKQEIKRKTIILGAPYFDFPRDFHTKQFRTKQVRPNRRSRARRFLHVCAGASFHHYAGRPSESFATLHLAAKLK